MLDARCSPERPYRPPPGTRTGRWPVLLAAGPAGCELAGMCGHGRMLPAGRDHDQRRLRIRMVLGGTFLIELPLAGLVARRATSRTMRTALLTLYGLVSYAPKLLRDPTSRLTMTNSRTGAKPMTF